MMNNNNVVLNGASSSECSSGCESGWTLYLEHSNSKFSVGGNRKMSAFHHGQDQQGPPHFDHDIDYDEEEEVFCYDKRKKQSMKLPSSPVYQCYKAEDLSLDDTASSSFFTSKKKVGGNKVSSQGFSATHFHQDRSTNFHEDQCGFFQPTYSTKQFQHNQWS
ncbi:uncharacterized protein LOC104904852 isoform X2 [Beta vulgaris subsp. vulgaris]|uniref:uncharacterized protein LOC104904852 isoform X2 n=1 Tax=Beta vulgaris subsp. vulgaris TaxID=3555 RepID=UPI002548B4A3|nr:uncharacterized protein LOC104904852 isoform X2 [Beta vulgaris subsp. vulgaris]